MDIEKESGNHSFGSKVDFTEEAEIEKLVQKAVDEFGKITGVINNVSWGANTPLWESDTEKMVIAYKLNTLGAYNLIILQNFVCLI